MHRKYQNIMLPSVLIVALFLLVGCSLFGKTSNANNAKSTGASPTVIAHSTVGTNKAGAGPIVIETPTPVLNGSPSSQQVALAGRSLVIENVSRQDDSAGGTTTITINIMIKNTGSKDIKNLVAYYQLVGVEGDMFGLPPATTGDFFSTIAAGTTRTGTLVFQQIPSAAIKKLQLLYRSESAQVVFVPLSI